MIIDCLNLPFDPLDVPRERSAGELVLFRAKEIQAFKRRMSPIHFPMQRTDPVQRSRPKQEPPLHDDAVHRFSGDLTALVPLSLSRANCYLNRYGGVGFLIPCRDVRWSSH